MPLGFDNSAVEAVSRWVSLLTTTPAAGPDRSSQIERIHADLTDLHRRDAEFTLRIGPTEIHYGDSVVRTDERGDAFFRRLFDADIAEFQCLAGTELSEIEAFIDAVQGGAAEHLDEGHDLVTSLWSLHLEHIRCHPRQVYAPEDVRASIQALEAAMLPEDPSLVFGDGTDAGQVSASFEIAAKKCAARIPAQMADAFASELATRNSHDGIAAQLAALLIDGLRRSPIPGAITPARTVLLQLYREMLTQRRFDTATRLVLRIQRWQEVARNDKEQALASEVFEELSSASALSSLLENMKSFRTEETVEALQLLDALGERAVALWAAANHSGSEEPTTITPAYQTSSDPDATFSEAMSPPVDAFADLDDEATMGVDPEALKRISEELMANEGDS